MLEVPILKEGANYFDHRQGILTTISTRLNDRTKPSGPNSSLHKTRTHRQHSRNEYQNLRDDAIIRLRRVEDLSTEDLRLCPRQSRP